MTLALTSPEDFINAALGRIGYKRRVGSIYDGSDASKASLDIYAQTRDDELRSFEWGFAERNATLQLLKTAPVSGYVSPVVWTTDYPILPWIFEYQCPGDMLKLRALRCSPIFIPEFVPKPVEYRIANDNAYNPTRKVILTNLPAAICVYTGQVTDPTVWEASFAETMIASLARRLAPRLADLNVEKAEAQDEAMTAAGAEMRLG